MRKTVSVLCLLLATRFAAAAENWFLPYQPDEQTIALFHLDAADAKQRSAAKPDISIIFKNEAAHAEGKFGLGAKLDGRKACLRLTKHDALRLGNGQAFTVELWCKPVRKAQAGLVSLATRFYLQIVPGRGTAIFGYRAASFPIRWRAITNAPITTGRWHHVALTHDAERVARLYVDGHYVGKTSHKDEGDFAKGQGGVFGAHDGWSKFFAGSIDEIRISNCVREFKPLVAKPYLVRGEELRLSLDPDALSERIRAAAITIKTPKRTLLEKRVERADLARAIAPATAMPRGKGEVVVAFLDPDGNAVATVSEPVGFVGPKMEDCRKRMAEIDATLRSQNPDAPRSKGLRLYLDEVDRLLDARRMADAENSLRAAERIARRFDTGETAYRAKLRQLVRSTPSDADVRITMSWTPDLAAAADALPWAKRIGANELVASGHDLDPKALALWREKGFHTVALSSHPIHDGKWLRQHPEQRQSGYWCTKPATAKSAALAIKIVSPSWGGQTSIDKLRKAKEQWRVDDLDDANAKPQWNYDANAKTVTVTNAAAGHRYVVYFRFWHENCGDPLYEPFAERGLAMLEDSAKQFDGSLQTYWFDDLAFAYPGPTPQGAWDWESYTLAARPEAVERFEKETGIAFDPAWLVMPPKTIEVAPDRRYLRWMNWLQPQVEQWMARCADTVHKRGMSAWVYWGDCHVGMEPFLGGLVAGRIDEIDKPTSDPVTARALIDFPGDNVRRRLRVMWLFSRVVGAPRCGARMDKVWRRAKRGLLMGFPSGIYWMPFPNVCSVGSDALREDLVETIAETNDEFTLLARRLNGHRAFTHPINVYVINAWGKVYSWRPWGAGRLAPLTDVPVNVRFISLDEITHQGVPADASVLYNYGQPNSAWSGGRFWESPKLAAAIDAFVRRGGGFIGMQSPSHCDRPKPHWALGELLGVTAQGTAEFKPARFDESMLADTALAPPEEAKPTTRLSKTRQGQGHWLAQPLPAHLTDMANATRVAATAADASVLFAARNRKGEMSPGVVVREVGAGRCVYLASWSQSYAYSRLLRRAIFWAARAEDKFGWLDVTGAEDLFVYAYPSVKIVAVMNAGDAQVAATLRCDPRVFGADAARTMRLCDAVTREVVFDGAGAQLAAGARLALAPNCVRLLEVDF